MTIAPSSSASARARRPSHAGTAKEGDKAETGKPRSGRPVTPRALSAAMKGGATAVSGPTKQRILRAVNYLLEQKKKDKVELKTLF